MTKLRPFLHFIAATVAVALLAAACGGGGSGESASGSPSAGGSDLSCDLLSPAFIGELLGEVVDVQDGQRDGSFRRANSACDWEASAGLESAAASYSVEVVLHPLSFLDGQIETFGGTDLDGPAPRTVLIGEGTAIQTVYVVDGEDLIKVFLYPSSNSAAPSGSPAQVAALQTVAAEVLANR